MNVLRVQGVGCSGRYIAVLHNLPLPLADFTYEAINFYYSLHSWVTWQLQIEGCTDDEKVVVCINSNEDDPMSSHFVSGGSSVSKWLHNIKMTRCRVI